jgi:AmmeMemoRadiSam system protein A
MSQPLPNSLSGQANSASATQPGDEFSAEERAALLRIAHQSIEAEVEGKPFLLEAPTPHLTEPRGVFTTIYYRNHLRGCVGYIAAVSPLYLAVAETARAAAFEDTRFSPVKRDEVQELEVSLSVLTAPQPIDPADVEIGRHGLLISQHGHRGLLLPQVATEHGWDRETFLRETCYKAGLPLDAWKHGARVEAFAAEVFSDSGTHK